MNRNLRIRPSDAWHNLLLSVVLVSSAAASAEAAPLFNSTPDFGAKSGVANSNSGMSVTVGDFNGDGHADSAYYRMFFGGAWNGAVVINYGSADGLGGPQVVITKGGTTNFGDSPAAIDVDKDGYCDLVVADPYNDDSAYNSGRLYLYKGSAAGLATTASWSWSSGVASSYLGLAEGASTPAIANVGDVNGDGYPDLLAGAREYNTSQ